MSFWVAHGLHLALVVLPASAMGAGLTVEHRRARQRAAVARPGVGRPGVGRPGVGAAPPGPAGPRPIDWLYADARGADHVGPGKIGGRRSALPAVAISAGAAALVHLVVMPEHFGESFLYGMFFLLAAILQMLWAIVVTYRPSRQVLIAGAAGCAATIVLWLVSRTIGIPAGLGGGAPEGIGALDVLATGMEAIAVIAVVVVLRASNPGSSNLGGSSPARWPRMAQVFAAVVLCGTAATAFLAPVS